MHIGLYINHSAPQMPLNTNEITPDLIKGGSWPEKSRSTELDRQQYEHFTN